MTTQYHDATAGWTDLGEQPVDKALQDLRDDGPVQVEGDHTAFGVRTVVGLVDGERFVLVGRG